ncbi:hypothetical protein GCM10027080_05770 [Pedococcus soli]
MAGTRTGGAKAAATNKIRYGFDFYKMIGRKGGTISRGGGFVGEGGRERARVAGAKGGKASRRGRAA